MESSLEPAKVPVGPERRVLELIYETFHTDAEWLTFQYLGARAWQELEVEARDVYYALSAAGLVRPRIQRDRAFELRDDTKVGINLRGLTHLRQAADDLAHFVSVVRCIGQRAARFRPSTATEVEHLHVISEELRLELGFQVGDLALRRQAVLLRDEAYSMWVSFSGPDASGSWSVVLNPERARRFRATQTLADFFAVEAAIHAEHAPPVIETRVDPRFAIPKAADAAGTSPATSHGSRDRSGPRPRAFISYSHRDRAFVDPFEAALRTTGVDVWIDHADLLTGDSLVTRIGDAIRDGDFVVAVISPFSVTSPWCAKELALAVTHGIRSKRVKILPLRLGDVDMPSFLADTVWEEADVTDPVAAAERIAAAIKRHLGLESQGGARPSTRESRPANREGRSGRPAGSGGVPTAASASAPAAGDVTHAAPAALPLRTPAEILELGSPTPGAPDHWVLHEGMLLLRLVVAPVPGGVRHPAAADPRGELEAAVRRGAQVAHAWPDDASLFLRRLRRGWRAGEPHVWCAGWSSSDAVSLAVRPTAAATFSTRTGVLTVDRTWPTGVVDHRGRLVYYAAREPEVAAELLISLRMGASLVSRVPGLTAVDVSILIGAAPFGWLVSSERAVPEGLFGEPHEGIVPTADVPWDHTDGDRFSLDDLRDPFQAAGVLIAPWLRTFRDDDLLAQLRDG